MLSSSGYTDTAAINGTTYYYVVSAEDSGGNGSALSSEVSATPLGGPLQVAYWRLDEGSGAVEPKMIRRIHRSFKRVICFLSCANQVEQSISNRHLPSGRVGATTTIRIENR